MSCPAYVRFMKQHYANPAGQRLGQKFYNLYLRGGDPWPELFYGEDRDTCHLINDWLVRNCYVDKLPPVVYGV